LRLHERVDDEKDEFPLPIPEQTVKIESEPDLFHVEALEDAVKEEPLDELEEFCAVDTLDYDYSRFEDPMRSVRRFSSDEPTYPSEKRLRFKPSSSKSKRDPPPSIFKCYLCNEVFHQVNTALDYFNLPYQRSLYHLAKVQIRAS
jgi:hypothetical protein